MTDSPLPDLDRDAPPLVSGLLMRGSERASRTFLAAARRIPERLQIVIWFGGSAALFVAVLVASIAQSPTLEGVLSGLLGGFFLALLFAAAGGWMLLWIRRPSRASSATVAAPPSRVAEALAPTLRELSRARGEVIRQVRARSVMRVPAGILAAVLLWILAQSSDDPPTVFDFFMYLLVGALGGELWAIGHLDRDYRRLYKDRVLPHLAKQFGELTYQQASAVDVSRLSNHRILKEFTTVKIDDEICGTYRTLPLRIVEARLEKRSGNNRQVVFDGVLVEVTLPRTLSGTTVLMPDAGIIGNLAAGWRSDGLEHVALEDPRFEARYEVYGSNQIEARALLTPAFMERFMALGERAGLTPPGAVAEGNRLMMALPKRVATDLFEPPAYWKASGEEVLVALSNDIRAVLNMADAIIELDFWASGRR